MNDYVVLSCQLGLNHKRSRTGVFFSVRDATYNPTPLLTYFAHKALGKRGALAQVYNHIEYIKKQGLPDHMGNHIFF